MMLLKACDVYTFVNVILNIMISNHSVVSALSIVVFSSELFICDGNMVPLTSIVSQGLTAEIISKLTSNLEYYYLQVEDWRCEGLSSY